MGFRSSCLQVQEVFPWHKVKSDKIPLTLETLREGTFRPTFKELQWIHSPESVFNDQGTYLLKDEDKEGHAKYVVKSVVDEDFQYTLLENSVFAYHGVDYSVDSLKASPDLSKAILKTDSTKGWRHSSTALYWVLDVKTGDIAPLLNVDEKLSVTSWSPTSDSIAFVFKNDVYVKILASNTISRITNDGSANIFNGKPDWVYEEEVFGTDIALWWSPQGDKLAFLKFDDTLVPEFSIPYYVQAGHDQYPEVRSIKYPKPGFPNPSVEVVVAQLPKASGGSFSTHVAKLHSDKINEKLITEVLWVSDNFVLIKTSNRASDLLEVFLVSTEVGAEAKLIRSSHAENSWFEVTSNAIFVPRNDSLGRYDDGYIDIVTSNGYNHLAFFTPPSNPEPFMLTSGQWEVISNHMDLSRNEVYFTATLDSSVERHFYSVNLLDVFHQQTSPEIKHITSGTSWYSGSFSSGSRFLLLNYQGPEVPHQSLVDLHDGKIVKVIEENQKLRNTLEKYELPKQNVSTITLDKDAVTGGEIIANTVEIFPPSFNESRKYPVLFYVYGGPGSQMVTHEFAVGFSQVVASQLNAIVVTVDGRGTGYNNRDSKLGSAFKFCVRDQLGHYEPLDQIAAAKQWAKRPYVDEGRISIWGWSYGGFLTLKTLETDEENVFSYGVAVAPVTKWKLYDSIYTERYMRTPQENPAGYETASISNAKRFSSVKRFLIMHGSGDDNVHFQNSLRLLDDYNLASVENFDFMVFPDSDHSIRYHNGNTVVFDRILDWLRRAFSNEFEVTEHPDHNEL
ncbi:hypothetical protein JCM33374_g4143 [Metschnikowia sp. JCM 33374]|nr:hypothetical protein JCM33374_g4143 [Metschnikowia sp. JCM 33374]